MCWDILEPLKDTQNINAFIESAFPFANSRVSTDKRICFTLTAFNVDGLVKSKCN